MSISNVNLRKQLSDFFFGSKKFSGCTEEDIEAKTKKCDQLFESLHMCV
jgi:hypothetical protein